MDSMKKSFHYIFGAIPKLVSLQLARFPKRFRGVSFRWTSELKSHVLLNAEIDTLNISNATQATMATELSGIIAYMYGSPND